MTRTRAVTTMAIATIASRILGFARVMVIAAVLGTTALGNTFQSTNSISNVLFDLLAAGALSAALVPQLVHALAAGKKDLNDMVSSLMTLVIVVLGTFTVIALFYADDIAAWLFSRAPIETRDEQIETGTTLLRFFLPQIVLYGIGAVAIAVLTAKKKFVTTVLAPMASSVVIIVCLLIFNFIHNSSDLELSSNSIILLGIAGTGACFAFVAIPVFVAVKNGVRMWPSANISQGARVLSSSMWAICIQAAAAIILGVTIFIGNNEAGAVVAYQLAFVFFLAPYAILSQSFSTVLLPDLSHETREGGSKQEFSSIVSTMMTYTYRPIAIISGICIALGEPMMRIVSGGRAQSGFELVEICFVTLIAGLLPYSLFQASSRIFFAKGNIRFPALAVLLSSIVVSAVAVIASRQVSGNALVFIMGATHTVVYVIAALVLLIVLHRQSFIVWPNKTSTLIIVGSIAYAVIGVLAEQAIDIQTTLEAVLFCVGFLALSLAGVALLTPRRYRMEFIVAVKNKRLPEFSKVVKSS
jgi:putative peptidoglycan lipid II flippase